MKLFTFGKLSQALLLSVVVAVGMMGCGSDGGNPAGGSTGTAPAITTATLPSGAAGTAYSQAIMASGDTPITWSLVSGTLPTGLSLFENGIISGTPITAGTFNFSVKASNSTGSNTKSLSITITGSTTPPISTTYSLDGVWGFGVAGRQVTISGSTGIVSALGSENALWTDAVNKGYVKIGDQEFRNITSTGNLTWSGQYRTVTYNTSSPNVATGTSWANCTFTMSADGQTLTVTGSSGSGTLTRIQ